MNPNVAKPMTDSPVTLLKAAQESAQKMQGPMMKDIVAYIEAMMNSELARCGILKDDVDLRRSQGAVSAYSEVLDLLTHTPAKQRRTTSRIEV